MCSDWRDIDLTSQSVALSIDGTERQRGTGAIVLNSPLNVLDWFVNVFSQQGGSIDAGQFVMTGTRVAEAHLPRRVTPKTTSRQLHEAERALWFAVE